MRPVPRLAITSACLLTLSAALAPAAVAGDVTTGAATDLSGRWNSYSLREDNVGYSMKLTAACRPATCYDAVLQLTFQDGTKGPRIKAGMTVDGSRVQLLVDGQGALDGPNANIVKGTLGMDGSLDFPTCHKQLAHVTKADADTMCLFQDFPR